MCVVETIYDINYERNRRTQDDTLAHITKIFLQQDVMSDRFFFHSEPEPGQPHENQPNEKKNVLNSTGHVQKK
jgi:hypothetical protein